MIKMSFETFIDGNYSDNEKFELYVLKDKSKKSLYIGITNTNPYNRWFSGSQSHCSFNIYGELFGRSPVGKMIEKFYPDSLSWTIYLYTPEDCMVYLFGSKTTKEYITPSIKELEPIMIKALKPSLNVTFNNYISNEDPKDYCKSLGSHNTSVPSTWRPFVPDCKVDKSVIQDICVKKEKVKKESIKPIPYKKDWGWSVNSYCG